MPGLVVDLLCCWHHWLGKFRGCLVH